MPDALNTPTWRALIKRMFSAEAEPVLQEWAARVTEISDYEAPDGHVPFWNAHWKYLHAVGVEDTNPTLAEQKIREAIKLYHQPMLITALGAGNSYFTHKSYIYALTYIRLLPYLTADKTYEVGRSIDPNTMLWAMENGEIVTDTLAGDVIADMWRAALIAKCRVAMGVNPSHGGPVTDRRDSDLLVGSMELVATVSLALETDEFFTAANRVDGGPAWCYTTWQYMVDSILAYLAGSQGGDWLESSMYNMGTVSELFMTLAFCGSDNTNPHLQPLLEAIAAYVPQAGVWYRWEHVPSDTLTQETIQYGDIHDNRELSDHYRVPLYHLIHTLGGDPAGHLLDFAKAMDPTIPSNAYLGHLNSYLCGFDPRWLPTTPVFDHPTGLLQTIDQIVFRTADRTSLVHINCPVRVVPWGIDHQQAVWNVCVWEDDEWMTDFLRSYGPYQRNHNTTEVYGFWQPEHREIVRAEILPGDILECELLASGPVYGHSGTFIFEQRRFIRYENGRLTVKDWAIAIDPPVSMRLPLDIYNKRIAPIAQFFHTKPGKIATPIENGFTFETANGRPRKLLTNATIMSAVPEIIWDNIGGNMEEWEYGGQIMQLGGEWSIETVQGPADDPLLDVPEPPGPAPEPPDTDPPPPEEPTSIIVDDPQAVFSPAQGQWLDHFSGYGNNVKYTGPAPATATWTIPITEAGLYRVAVTWPGWTDRATNALFTVNGVEHRVDQRPNPASFNAAGADWHTLTEIDVTGPITVILNAADADGSIVADAVMAIRLGASEPDPDPDPDPDPEPGIEFPLLYGSGKYRAFEDRLEIVETQQIPRDPE